MKVKLSDLKHHPLNKKIYLLSDIPSLMESIEQVGLLQPLVVDSKMRILSGHRRFEAIKRLKWEHVTVHQVSVKEEEIPLLLVSYNRNRIKKASELCKESQIIKSYYSVGQGSKSHLKNNNGEKVNYRKRVSDELNVSEGQLSKLLYIEKRKPEFIDLIDKDQLTVNQAWLSLKRIENEQNSIKQSNVKGEKNFHDPKIKIYNKSSIKMDEVPDNTVQLIITSPSYFRKREYGNFKGVLGNEKDLNEYIDRLSKHLDACIRVLKKEGSMFLNLGDTYDKNGSLLNVPHRVILRLLERHPKILLRNVLYWKKVNPLPSSSKRSFTNSVEIIFFVTKSNNYYFKQVKIPTQTKQKNTSPPRRRGNLSGSYTPFIGTGSKNLPDFLSEEVIENIIETSVANQSIVKKRLGGLEHTAPFPPSLIRTLIEIGSRESDTLLDCFSGSFMTCIEGLKMNRNVIGYEINPNYCKAIIKYLKEEKYKVESY
jgi:DNA modification methylase